MPPVSVNATVSAESPRNDAANRHALADAVIEAAADEAGTARHPGRYLYLPNMEVRLWVFSFKGYRNRPIALASVNHIHALIVLIGSAGNVSGYRNERPLDGWIPSDPIGLRHLLRFGADADLDDQMGSLLESRSELDAATRVMFGEAEADLVADAGFIGTSIQRTPDLRAGAEILAKVHEYRDEVEVISPVLGHRRTFPRVIVDAPIVIREPSARPTLL